MFVIAIKVLIHEIDMNKISGPLSKVRLQQREAVERRGTDAFAR